MILNSIRWRLQAWHSLILVVVLTGFGVTAYRVARGNQLRRIDQELQQRLMIVFRPGPPNDHRLTKGPRPEGPPKDRHPNDFGHEHDPSEWRQHMQEVIANAGGPKQARPTHSTISFGKETAHCKPVRRARPRMFQCLRRPAGLRARWAIGPERLLEHAESSENSAFASRLAIECWWADRWRLTWQLCIVWLYGYLRPAPLCWRSGWPVDGG